MSDVFFEGESFQYRGVQVEVFRPYRKGRADITERELKKIARYLERCLKEYLRRDD